MRPICCNLWVILSIQHYDIPPYKTLVYLLNLNILCIIFTQHSGLSFIYNTLMCPLLTKLRFVLLIQHSDVPPLHKTPVYPVHTTVINILSTQHPGVSSLCNTLMCPLCKNLWFILSIQNSLVYLYNTQLNTQYKTLMCPSPQNSLPSYNPIIYPIYTRPWCILFTQHFDVPLLHKSLVYPLNTTL